VAQSFRLGRYAVAIEGSAECVRVRPDKLCQDTDEVIAVSDEVVAAAERGDEAAVLAWLDGGGRVDATYERGDVSGITLLMGAAYDGHERLVDLLLRHGAEVNQKDSDGRTALMDAATMGRWATSEWSTCCFGAARRSTCRAAWASPR